MTSGAIYIYNCGGCSSQYVGKTIRHLSTRMSEHKGVSVRTGKALAVPPHSEIRAHVKKRECAIREENFKILERSKWDRNLLILESILIKSLKPDLNKQEGTYLHVFWRQLVSNLRALSLEAHRWRAHDSKHRCLPLMTSVKFNANNEYFLKNSMCRTTVIFNIDHRWVLQRSTAKSYCLQHRVSQVVLRNSHKWSFFSFK